MRTEKLKKGIQNMPTVTTELLTRKQVASLFQISVLSVIRMEQDGKLPAVRLGAGTVRYKRSTVEKFINDALTVNS
jgi:excisionase family DNA binding protein